LDQDMQQLDLNGKVSCGSLTKIDGSCKGTSIRQFGMQLRTGHEQLDHNGKVSCGSLTAKTRACRRKAKAP
jgi:hypothetical protein